MAACTGEVAPTDDGAVETRFVELFYLAGGRTGIRFEGMPDIYVPDADADRLALAVSTGGESQVEAESSAAYRARISEVRPHRARSITMKPGITKIVEPEVGTLHVLVKPDMTDAWIAETKAEVEAEVSLLVRVEVLRET